MNRSQQILAGLLGVQIVLILLMRAPFSGSTTSAENVVLFPDLEQVAVTRLQFDGAEDDALTLEKREGEWIVREVDGYPADENKIDELLATLGELAVRRPVVSSGRYHKVFEVDARENNGRVRVWGAGEEAPAADLILGSSPNYRAINVRRADDDRVYEVRGLASYDVSAKPSFWAEKQLVDVSEPDVSGIRITNSAGTFELERRGGEWVATAPAEIAGQALDAAQVDTLVRQARSVRIDNPVGTLDEAAHGLGTPEATVVLRWQPATGGEDDAQPSDSAPVATPQEVTIRIGGKVPDQDSQRYVARSGFGFASTVWESSVNALLERVAGEMLSGSSADDGDGTPEAGG